jgi:hypothetical protein
MSEETQQNIKPSFREIVLTFAGLLILGRFLFGAFEVWTCLLLGAGFCVIWCIAINSKKGLNMDEKSESLLVSIGRRILGALNIGLGTREELQRAIDQRDAAQGELARLRKQLAAEQLGKMLAASTPESRAEIEKLAGILNVKADTEQQK